MNKKFIKLIALMLALLCLPMQLFIAAAAGNESSGEEETDKYVTLECASQSMSLITVGGELNITPAVLTRNGENTEIFVITICGLTYDSKKLNNTFNAILSAFNLRNGYLTFVNKVICDNVPEGSDIVLVGHSLGGMIAQQLAGDNVFQGKYNIIHTLTGGSPYIITRYDKEGTMNRLTLIPDKVPYMSPAHLIAKTNHEDRIIVDAGFTDAEAAHNTGYFKDEIWGAYDALGCLGGDAEITYFTGDMLSFDALKSIPPINIFC